MKLFETYIKSKKFFNDNVTDYLKSKNLEIESYLKSGTKGSIYSLKNGNILKVSTYNIESQYNDYSLMVGKNNKYLVDIISCFFYHDHLFIEMEKLNKIQFNSWRDFDNVNSLEQKVSKLYLSFLNYFNKEDDFYDSIEVFLKDEYNTSEFSTSELDVLKEEFDVDNDDIEMILEDLEFLFNAQKELSDKYGLYYSDFHSNNIMECEKTNGYKAIDFI
jgi:hypothetical protein